MSRPPSSQPSGAAAVLMLVIGGLIAVAAEPAWRMLTGPLLGLLLVTVLVLMAGPPRSRPGPVSPAPPRSPAPVPPSPVSLAPTAPAPGPSARSLADLSPREFELHVAELISALPGWQAQATRGRADQGADVLASGPGGVRVAVQVKRYRAAVGNGAVQAIVASKAVYDCTHAVVVTSGPGYTRSARELAQANGVGLWQAGELATLRRCARQGVPPPPELLPGRAGYSGQKPKSPGSRG